MFVKINGTNFVRDTSSMALTNKDNNGLEDYMLKRKLLSSQKDEINTIKAEINGIKTDMLEIKSLMRQLLDKGSNG